MNAQESLELWDRTRLINGIALRCIEKLPEASLDQHPVPNMRTPKELAVHLYGTIIKAMGEGIASGRILAFDEAAAVASFQTKEALLAWCRSCWSDADRAMRGITDARIAGTVKTPWPFEAPGHEMLYFLYEEVLHHRGQLYAFLRVLGVAPPENSDFANNAPEFQPKAQGQPR